MHAIAIQRYPASILFAVSVIWNGTVVTGPILIYHDEITDDLTTVPTVGNSNGPGDLVCRSENHEEARWRHPRGFSVPTSGNYRQVESAAGVPSLSQLSTPIDGEEPMLLSMDCGSVKWLIVIFLIKIFWITLTTWEYTTEEMVSKSCLAK